ncbi:MAG TPA: nucleotidyltransferase family protein [bacterium]
MESRLVGLLLAAGSSRRMGEGRLKQLLPLGGRPVLSRCLETLGAAGLAQTVVVLAPGIDARAALDGFAVTVAVNPAAGGEMADSVRSGLCAVEAGATGVLVALADHPLVAAESVRALAAAHRARPECIHIPAHRGRRGHPVVFPASFLREVLAGATMRGVRDAHMGEVRECPVEDPGVLFDMDRWEDYEAACAQLACAAAAPARARGAHA